MEIKGEFTYTFQINDPIRKRGKNGVVWLATQKESGNFAIIKWHKNPASKIPIAPHTHIQSPIEEIVHEGKIFSAYAYLKGEDLQQQFDQRKKIWRKADFIVAKWIQTLEILDHIHQQQLLHGDIKLSNLIYDASEDQMKLIDLDSVAAFPLQQPMQRAFIFSAPEQFLQVKELTGTWSDIFSSGICFYSLLSQALPYSMQHPAMLEQMQLSLPLPKREEIPDSLFPIFQKCCAKPLFPKPPGKKAGNEEIKALVLNIAARYAKASDLITDLKNLDLSPPKKWYSFLKF